MAKTATIEQPEVVDATAVDDILADLDLNLEAGDTEAIEEIEAEASEEVNGEIIGEQTIEEVQADLDREEVYQAQEAPMNDVSTDPTTVPAEPEAKKAKGTKSSAPKTPRTPKDLASVGAEFFVLSGDPTALDAAALDANKTAVMAAIPGQKKIAEKFENLFQSVAAGRKPSIFVQLAYKLLAEKNSVSSSEIVAAYKLEDYSEGTARSQAGQIMNLFAAVGIADRAGQSLTLKADSTIAKRLAAIV